MNGKRTRSTGAQRLALLGALTLLAGCQHHAPPGPGTIPAPPQQVESGSRFVLRTPLSFPAASGEVLLQNQRVAAGGKPAPNMPYCRLRPAKGGPGVMPPGTYTVSSVGYDEKEVGSTSAMVSVTRIALGAGTGQPAYALSCGWPDGSQSPAFVTTQQIYDAIGGQFSMDLLR